MLFASPAFSQQALPWEKMPRMQLERQFAGPLKDTIIQRWRDPADGMICYIYLPITAQHSAPTPEGFVQYGANNIGSLSCLAPGAALALRPSISKPGKETKLPLTAPAAPPANNLLPQ